MNDIIAATRHAIRYTKQPLMRTWHPCHAPSSLPLTETRNSHSCSFELNALFDWSNLPQKDVVLFVWMGTSRLRRELFLQFFSTKDSSTHWTNRESIYLFFGSDKIVFFKVEIFAAVIDTNFLLTVLLAVGAILEIISTAFDQGKIVKQVDSSIWSLKMALSGITLWVALLCFWNFSLSYYPKKMSKHPGDQDTKSHFSQCISREISVLLIITSL